MSVVPVASLWVALMGFGPPVLTDDSDDETAVEPGAEDTEEATSGRGTLVVGPGSQGTVRVEQGGNVVVTLDLQPADRHELSLPAGTYRVVGPDDAARDVAVQAGRRTVDTISETTVELPPEPQPPTLEDDGGDSELELNVNPPEHMRPALTRATRRKAGLHSLASVFYPGAGAILNRQGPKGAGIFIGSALLAGLSVWTAIPPRDPTRQDFGNEAARLTAYGVFTGGLGLLYAGQIMDAYRVATGRPVESNTEQKVNLQFGRMLTIGLTPDVDGIGYYRNWTLSVLGQPAPRVELGASDLGLIVGSRTDRTGVQMGGRVGYRVMERRVTWMTLSVGALAQLTTADQERDPLDVELPRPPNQFAVGSAAFAQLQMSVFINDRWSLDLTPRFSLPLSTRYYARGLSIARFSPTLEMGSGVGAHF